MFKEFDPKKKKSHQNSFFKVKFSQKNKKFPETFIYFVCCNNTVVVNKKNIF